ncbi:hypothetical protein [Streptomyces sp. AK02-01A]|uniref:hypothetical protein n=1 Tax=Streptomyces sp. AK02-01A TaxID=3028648 RepID=UPI0029B3AF70|nr:hypothetical protein [Streptomyces sp. AK02-01A]MDX3854308.1 hypothetical protein [Streptomyces sp. AK02-01A]
MNSADHPEAQVVVAISGQAKEDAHAVFGVLRTAFGCDRAADDVPQDVPGKRPTVWTATFDVFDVRTEPGPVRLTEPVTATLQGGYTAVDSLRKALASAFAVRVVGTASGDQEEEVQLRLESR